MGTMVALVIGYVMGAKTGGKELDQLGRSLKALLQTEEFADVVSAGRGHLGASLRDLASIIDGGQAEPEASGDLVARVRSLVGHE